MSKKRWQIATSLNSTRQSARGAKVQLHNKTQSADFTDIKARLYPPIQKQRRRLKEDFPTFKMTSLACTKLIGSCESGAGKTSVPVREAVPLYPACTSRQATGSVCWWRVPKQLRVGDQYSVTESVLRVTSVLLL